MSHSDPIYVTHLGHLTCSFSSTTNLFSYLPSSITEADGKIPSASNAWSILQKSVKFMKRKYMTSFCPCGWGYNEWPTQCYVSRGRSTLCVSSSSFLPPGKRLWNSYLHNMSISFNNSRCMWKLVVYRGATWYPLRSRAEVCFLYHPRRRSMLSFSDHRVDSQDESKSFKITFVCRGVRSSISLPIGPILNNSYPLANLPSTHHVWPPPFPTLCIKLQWQNLTRLNN